FRSEEESLARAHGCAHWQFSNRGSIVALVALHHQLHASVHLRNTEGASQNTVVAGNAARLPCCLHYTVTSPFDGMRRTHFRTSGRIAVHTNDRHSLRRVSPINVVELNHRVTLV